MNKKPLFHSAGGYTLLEALLTIAMSAILLLAISGLVGSLFGAYKISRQAQVDLEEARAALGILTKTIRPATLLVWNGNTNTSTIMDGGSTPSEPATTLYAYSNDLKECISFQFANNSLEYAKSLTNGDTMKERAEGCKFTNPEYKKVVVSTIKDGKFYMVPSTPLSFQDPKSDGSAGHVTVRLTVETDATHTSDLQTTVSLRDYEYIGFKK